MSASCFVDTKILIYALDASASEKHRLALALVQKLWETGGLDSADNGGRLRYPQPPFPPFPPNPPSLQRAQGH